MNYPFIFLIAILFILLSISSVVRLMFGITSDYSALPGYLVLLGLGLVLLSIVFH